MIGSTCRKRERRACWALNILDERTVVERAEASSKKRRRLLAGGITFYGLLWLFIVVIILVNYGYRVPKVKTASFKVMPEPKSTFSTASLLVIVFLIVALVISALYESFRNGFREGFSPSWLRPVKYSPAGTLESAIGRISAETRRKALLCRIIQSRLPNAFGSLIGNKPAIVVTSGLIQAELSENEMAAIAAHEVAHFAAGEAGNRLRNLFFSLMILAPMVFTCIFALATQLWLLDRFVNPIPLFFKSPWSVTLFLPLVIVESLIVWFYAHAISWQDDLYADALAVKITKDPEALISAIEKVAALNGTQRIWPRRNFEFSKSFAARLFVNPDNRITRRVLEERELPGDVSFEEKESSWTIKAEFTNEKTEDPYFIDHRLSALRRMSKGEEALNGSWE
jgi:Zn-dependent protease with chaperone function